MNRHKLLRALLCAATIIALLPSTVKAASATWQRPISYDAEGNEQPITPEGYGVPIDAALYDELVASRLDAIAKKNAYFKIDADRDQGILFTDIAMLGDLPTAGVDVLFVTDVNRSMNMYANADDNAPYACSCCNEDHYYCIPRRFSYRDRDGKLYIVNSGDAIYFNLKQLESELKAYTQRDTPLVGICWTNMPWTDILDVLDCENVDPNDMLNFISDWQPASNHYKYDKASGTYTQIAKESAPPGDPAYYSPTEGYQAQHGCSDRMTIARGAIEDIAERVLEHNAKSHVGFVDFAGDHGIQSSFTSSLVDVKNFLSKTEGYDYAHYHLGLENARMLINDHFANDQCDNPLYVVFIADDVPDYKDYGSGPVPRPIPYLSGYITDLHKAIKAACPQAAQPGGNGPYIYTAGICIPSSTPFQGKTADDWLKLIATENSMNGAYTKCKTIAEFKTFLNGLFPQSSAALPPTLSDKLGSDFEFICDATHPITVGDYFNRTLTSYYSVAGLPEYIKVDEAKGTIRWDIDSMSIYRQNSQTFAGLRLSFYSRLKDPIMPKARLGKVNGKFPTNSGDATLTYADADNKQQVITMPSPYVVIQGAKRVPKTGDPAPIALWLALGAASLAGMGAALRRRRDIADRR